MPDCTCNVFPANLGNISFGSTATIASTLAINAAAAAGRLHINFAAADNAVILARDGTHFATLEKKGTDRLHLWAAPVGGAVGGLRVSGGPLEASDQLIGANTVLAQSPEVSPSAGNGTAPALRLTGTNTAGGVYNELQFGRWPGAGSRYAAISGQLWNASTNTTGHIVFSNRSTPTDANLTERLRITETGRIGIGTNNPEQLASTVHITTRATDGRALSLDTPGSENALSLVRAGTEIAAIRKAPNEPLLFYSAATGGAAPTAAGFEFRGGNVGIGTMTPSGRLHVVNPKIPGVNYRDAISIDFADLDEAIQFYRSGTSLGGIYQDSTGANPGPLTIYSLANAGTTGAIRLWSAIPVGQGFGVECFGDVRGNGTIHADSNIQAVGAFYALSAGPARKVADKDGCYYA
jgi:hypothetical protein